MRLRGLGARVTVSARREADFARMYSAGYHCLDTRRLEGQLHAFPLIINTVPADILSRAVLADCAPDTCCWIWRPEKAASVRTRKIFAASFTR